MTPREEIKSLGIDPELLGQEYERAAQDIMSRQVGENCTRYGRDIKEAARRFRLSQGVAAIEQKALSDLSGYEAFVGRLINFIAFQYNNPYPLREKLGDSLRAAHEASFDANNSAPQKLKALLEVWNCAHFDPCVKTDGEIDGFIANSPRPEPSPTYSNDLNEESRAFVCADAGLDSLAYWIIPESVKQTGASVSFMVEGRYKSLWGENQHQRLLSRKTSLEMALGELQIQGSTTELWAGRTWGEQGIKVCGMGIEPFRKIIEPMANRLFLAS